MRLPTEAEKELAWRALFVKLGSPDGNCGCPGPCRGALWMFMHLSDDGRVAHFKHQIDRTYTEVPLT